MVIASREPHDIGSIIWCSFKGTNTKQPLYIVRQATKEDWIKSLQDDKKDVNEALKHVLTDPHPYYYEVSSD